MERDTIIPIDFERHDTVPVMPSWIVEQERKVLRARSFVVGLCSCLIGQEYVSTERLELIKKDHLGDHEYLQLASDLETCLARDVLFPRFK